MEIIVINEDKIGARIHINAIKSNSAINFNSIFTTKLSNECQNWERVSYL